MNWKPLRHEGWVTSRPLLLLMCLFLATACQPEQSSDQTGVTGATVSQTADDPPVGEPTAAQAAAFVTATEVELQELAQYSERVQWVQANFITFDTELLAAKASEAFTAARVAAAAEAARFAGVEGLDPDTARKLKMLTSGIIIPAPLDPAKTSEQAELGARLSSLYGKGKYCNQDGECLALGALENILAESRNADELLETWDGWHQVAQPMKPLYARQVELANEGARQLGFGNVGTMWRSGYDMEPDAFAGEVDRVWGQVKPLYEALHCHTRAKLGDFYGTDLVPQDGPIPAHLLGNMWAQSWEYIDDIVVPETGADTYDLSKILVDRGYDAVDLVRIGEAFFSSLGFAPLPETFWERSLFVKPADREVQCHASAWDIDEKDDLRIKMCIEVGEEDFKTIHHELGHNYYQRAYKDLTYLYRDSANDGFHEAVGDTLSLSITPDYLLSLDLIDAAPDASNDIAFLMRQALAKVAFLPFGLLVDQWRWKVFAGEAGPDQYNDLWWELREEYQGVAAPNDRPADAFDPGAKYHVPGNTPYSRYFLAHILQFQFYQALCDVSGHQGPIHRCSFYASEEAGERLNAMLEMGKSKPWPEALETLTGSPEMDAAALLDYFAPLQDWLDEQNQGRECGW